jgi:hypothetical protein
MTATLAATRALIAKELRQHAGALVGLSLLLALCWLLAALIFHQQARTLSVLQLVPRFAVLPLGAAALYLGHRLVVAENYGRTQRFVEALPVHRGHLLLVKAGFGLAVLLMWAGAALAAGLVLSRADGEPVSGRFVAILASRLGLFVFAVWGAVFLLGWFGRLRLLLGLGVVVAVLLLDRQTGWQMQEFGPFALVADDRFAFERDRFPVRAMIETALLGAACFAAAWSLGRVREGSVVEALARPLSARELSALVLVGAGVALAFTALDPDTPATPYAFTTDKVWRAPGDDPVLEIAYLEDELAPAAARLGAELAPTLRAFGPALGWPGPRPPVRLVHGPEVRPSRPRPVQTDADLGTALRINLAALAAGEPASTFIAHVLHQQIWARSRGRAGSEPRHWLLDGFTQHFAEHGVDTSDRPADAREQTTLRALVAAELIKFTGDSAEQQLTAYYQTSERLGDELSLALVASGWRVLQARVGRTRTLALARAAFARQATGDVRDFLHDRRHPVPAMFEQATGWSWPEFLRSWTGELERLRAQPPAVAVLAQLLPGEVELRAGVGEGVGVVGQLQAGPGAPRICSLQHLRLPAFDAPFDPDALEEVSFVWPAVELAVSRLVRGSYGRGERAFVALDCELPGLTCPARLLAGRVTVP